MKVLNACRVRIENQGGGLSTKGGGSSVKSRGGSFHDGTVVGVYQRLDAVSSSLTLQPTFADPWSPPSVGLLFKGRVYTDTVESTIETLLSHLALENSVLSPILRGRHICPCQALAHL
eukprot:8282759-Pyramimonas_sp.AAC.1